MADMAGLGSWVAALLFVGVVVPGAVGCGPGESSSTDGTGGGGGDGGGGGPVCPEDPAEGPVPEECGIWVSASLGNDGNAGTQAEPVASLMRAIELANDGPERVYACGETWSETLVVPFGVSLYGGFDCEANWAYLGEPKRMMVTSPGPIAITWVADEPEGKPSMLVDFYVEASDAVEPGASSIGVFVRDVRPLTILRGEVVAGNGADGADGEPGDVNPPTKSGTPGTDGADACSAAVSAGGSSMELNCPGSAPNPYGGKGGDAGSATAEDGQAGGQASDVPGGEGGLGQQSAPTCTSGAPGAPGMAGSAGYGGDADGRLEETGYVGDRGVNGSFGIPGQGGGGGGAMLGSALVCGAANPGGAAGGSGGTGGCGGWGGRGGQGGGGSLPLALRGDVDLQYILLRSRRGGNGGNGGPPQLGASGGAGGKGGNGTGSIPPGCAGGAGGTGGKGGWGGGGAGGPSLGVVYALGVGAPPLWEVDWDLSMIEGGTGGIGDPTDPDSDGALGPAGQLNGLEGTF